MGVCGAHWPGALIDDIKIKITIRPDDGIVPLPKFEEYINATDAIKLDHVSTARTEEHVFRWQEKIFSPWEVQEYGDAHNCTTELHLKYHEVIKSRAKEWNKLFTYVDEDNYTLEPQHTFTTFSVKTMGPWSEEVKQLTEDIGVALRAASGEPRSHEFLRQRISMVIQPDRLTTDTRSFDELSDAGGLGSCLRRLQLAAGPGGVVEEPTLRSLCRGSSGDGEWDDGWVAMHVMLDDGKVDSEADVVKRESLLLSLFHNPRSGCLIVKPDVNELEWNPHSAATETGRYRYAVELCYEEHGEEVMEARRQFIELVKKLKRKWDRKCRHLFNFAIPPPATRRYFVALEILSAADFEGDNVYIEYEVRPPSCSRTMRLVAPSYGHSQKAEDLTASSPVETEAGGSSRAHSFDEDGKVESGEATDCAKVEGRTHTARLRRLDEKMVANYGHMVEFEVDCDVDDEECAPPAARLYLEAISRDWWGRHSTQGYASAPLALRPGTAELRLRCVRACEGDGESRRFFLGGCHLLDDVSWLAVPDGHEGTKLNKFGIKTVASGCVLVRLGVVAQAQAGGAGGRSDPLLRSVGAVLREYGRARRRLLACKGDLHLAGPSFSGG